MPKTDVWFVIPSANPAKCRKHLPVWRERGYKVAVLQNFERGEIPADITVWRDTYPGWPESVNTLCREVVPRDCDLIVTGGDDMLPDPHHQARDLADQFFERFPDGFGVMQPHGDEFLAARRYCGSPFIGRAFFETMYGGRGPMYGRYHHNYADNELFWVAKGLGALWSRPDLTHFHAHFTRDKQAQPAYWASVKKNDLHDCLLYYARVHEHFPEHQPRPHAGAPTRAYDRAMNREEMLVLAHQRLIQLAIDNPIAARVGGALARCAEQGQDPVAIYGFGFHTRAAAAVLAEPPVRVACLIDDNPGNLGRTPWGIPVVSREQALRLGVKAVVLSGESVEDRLWANCEIFRAAGVAVHRLYANAAAGATV